MLLAKEASDAVGALHAARPCEGGPTATADLLDLARVLAGRVDDVRVLEVACPAKQGGIVTVTVDAGRVRVGSNSFRLEGTTDCPGYTYGGFEQAPWTFEWCYCYVSFPWPNLSDDERTLPLQIHDDGTATAAGPGSGTRENGTTFEYAIEVTFRPG